MARTGCRRCAGRPRRQGLVHRPRVELGLELLQISGIESTGNSTSTTGAGDSGRPGRPRRPGLWVSSIVDSHVLPSLPARWRRRGVDAADDLADFLGDAGLTGLVGDPGVLDDELVGVVRRRTSWPSAGRELDAGRLGSAKKIRLWTYCGSSPSRPGSGEGSNSERQHVAGLRLLPRPPTTSSGSSRTCRLLDQHRAGTGCRPRDFLVRPRP